MEKYNDKKEAATKLRVSVHAINKWLSEKKLHGTKVGTRTVISDSALEAFVEKCNR